MSYLVQVGGQAVVEVMHGQLLVGGDHHTVPVRSQSVGAEEGVGLGDAGPEAPRAAVHAGCPGQEGRGGHADRLDELQPAAHAGGGGGDAAAERDRHGWKESWKLGCRWWEKAESLRGVTVSESGGHL